jgi:hypothetical protein
MAPMLLMRHGRCGQAVVTVSARSPGPDTPPPRPRVPPRSRRRRATRPGSRSERRPIRRAPPPCCASGSPPLGTSPWWYTTWRDGACGRSIRAVFPEGEQRAWNGRNDRRGGRRWDVLRATADGGPRRDEEGRADAVDGRSGNAPLFPTPPDDPLVQFWSSPSLPAPLRGSRRSTSRRRSRDLVPPARETGPARALDSVGSRGVHCRHSQT